MAEIRWYGHNCVRVRGKEAIILIDPVGKNTGYTMTKQTADIVLLTHQHAGHTNLAAIKPEFIVIDGPGEYEMHDVFVFGIRAYHDNENGALLGSTTMYTFQLEGMKFAHLGDLGHPLREAQLEMFEETDVLFAPAGGGPMLSASAMAEVVGQISPRLVIPIQYRTDSGDASREPVDGFCKQLGMEKPSPAEKLTLRAADLTDQMQLVLLSPDA